MKKTLLFVLASLITLCTNAFTLGYYTYEPLSGNTVDVLTGNQTIHYSENAVKVKQCTQKDVVSASILPSVSEDGIDYKVEYVESLAYAECRELAEVTVGENLKLLPDVTFASCPVKKLVWNAENCVIETDYPLSTFLDDSWVTWKYLTLQFENVEDVVVGQNVKVLPNLFVAHSNITSVDIPSSVGTIYEFAFSGCPNLEEVHVHAPAPSSIKLGHRVFHETADHCTLYVPRGSAELYRQADQWKDFQNIVEESEEEQNPYDLNRDGQVDVSDVNKLIDYILGK